MGNIHLKVRVNHHTLTVIGFYMGNVARNIERFECVQILNALNVIEFVFKML